MNIIKVIFSILVLFIGTFLLCASVAFCLELKKYAPENFGIGSYLLFLFVPSLCFIILILIKRSRALMKITVVYLTTFISFYGFFTLDFFSEYSSSVPFFNFIGYDLYNYGNNWEKIKSIEIGFLSIILPFFLFINALIMYFFSNKIYKIPKVSIKSNYKSDDLKN